MFLVCNSSCVFSQGGMGAALLSDPDKIESVSITLWVLNCLKKYYMYFTGSKDECIEDKFVKARVE